MDEDDLFAAFDDDAPAQPKRPAAAEDSSKKSTEDLVASIIKDSKRKTDYQTGKDDGVTDVKKARLQNAEDDDVEEMDALKGDNAAEEDKKMLGLVESAPRITVHTLDTPGSCTHEVAVPPGQEYVPLKPPTGEPAKTYKFTLDPFQSEAIMCISNDQSVLVSAHTSAGKTVTAEYAIAQSLKRKQRVIYTTPIKALSNQKYREFHEEFSDVGLVTGDVTINPSASCLIMTTEILRSMLYRGSEIMREVAWVIFDEIHYMRDKERGVVWEETIILLPDNVHYVFLSATIPNARQFAEWISHLHKQPCHVVYTDYRPTPLQHYMFPAGGDGIHLVVDEHSQFKEENFAKAMAVLGGGPEKDDDPEPKKPKGKKNVGNAQNSCFKVVKMIMERNFAPVIIFSFSKKECEGYALAMAKLDFNTPEEKKLVDEVFNNAMTVLSEEDRALPQVQNVLPLLKRGIGIHHGGLLPILKETTEILFGEGLIKALFATETFAMGLNMPARTVLFTNVQKFDGKDFRWISSGEYIQMSGRAGRRGLDDKGIVIMMVDESMSAAKGRSLVMGSADKLNSAFHLTYNMVLNLLRVEEINPEFMMERSFHQFQNYSNIPKLFEDVRTLETKVGQFSIENEDEVASYYKLGELISGLSKELTSWLVKPQYLVPFLQPGRLVSVKHGDKDFGWGAVINFKKVTPSVDKSKNPVTAATEEPAATYVVDVLLHVTTETSKSTSTAELMPVPVGGKKGTMVVVPIESNLINRISSIKLFLPKDLRSPDDRKSVLKKIEQVFKRFDNKVPLLDPIDDLKIKDKAFKEIVTKNDLYEKRLRSHPMHKNPDRKRLLDSYGRKDQAAKELEKAKGEVKRAKSLLQMNDLKCMKRVLRRMGYSTMADVIEVKGRIACELSSADELLLTEMMFNGMFNEMSPEQCASILSCFVCDEKSNEAPRLTQELSGPLRQMQDMAKRIAQVSKEAKIELDEEEYIGKFKPFMMDVVFEWCKGAKFSQICKMTELFEGSVIRSMRRLEELMRQMVQASKNIGNTELENKFSEAIKLLKRDIVFAASLYL